jgi:hypothetical protein
LAIQICDGAGDPNTAQTKTAITRAAKNGAANSLEFIDRETRTAIFERVAVLGVMNVTAKLWLIDKGAMPLFAGPRVDRW